MIVLVLTELARRRKRLEALVAGVLAVPASRHRHPLLLLPLLLLLGLVVELGKLVVVVVVLEAGRGALDDGQPLNVEEDCLCAGRPQYHVSNCLTV